MRVKNFFTILIAFGLFVNCLGLVTDKKDSGLDKNAENLLLADYLNLANNLNETKVEYLEINGKWKDNFDGEHYIFAQKNAFLGFRGFWEVLYLDFNSYTIRLIVEFDNNTKTLYVKEKNSQGVEKYSRIVWTKYNNHYYYCEIVYNKGSLEEAKRDSTTADSSNPESGGCGGSDSPDSPGFPWTKFDQKLN